MSFLEDIATQLNSLGIGVYPSTTSAWTIYIDEMQDIPDACISLYARPGRGMELFCDLEYPELHIEVRAGTYNAAKTKAEAIRAALHGQHDMVWNGHKYLTIEGRGPPCVLERSRGRTILYLNFKISKGA